MSEHQDLMFYPGTKGPQCQFCDQPAEVQRVRYQGGTTYLCRRHAGRWDDITEQMERPTGEKPTP